MQLKQFIALALFAICFQNLTYSQEANTETKKEPEKETVEGREKIKVDLLANYYDQDGDHSPVTGGTGTEDQQVIAPVIIVNIPIKKRNILDINVGIDNISSASTDKIDGATSSPSSQDTRVHANVWYTRKLNDMRHSFGIMGGFSAEYDVRSIQAGLRYTFQTLDQNQEVNFTVQVFNDTWDLIYPLELRPNIADGTLQSLDDDTRQSFNFSVNYSSVLTKNLQGSITADITQQSGLLSTPFHRVFLDDGTTDIERLPDSRLKIALGLRLNYFFNDYFTTRFFLRTYFDDFGINAYSAECEIPIKINNHFMFAPFYRFYTQTAADYFYPDLADASSEFHTADYDLSEFNSNLFGLHFKYTTLWSAAFAIDSIDLRFSRYSRDDGLDANSISIGFSTSF